MTEDKFTELVNLYFDEEISAEDLEKLKVEIAANPERKRAFAERNRLHQAMRLVLEPEGKRSKTGTRSRRRIRTGIHASALDTSGYSSRRIPFRRTLFLSGLTASIVLGFVFLPQMFQEVTGSRAGLAQSGLDGREMSKEDPFSALGRSEMRRFASAQQQREVQRHASLVSQMRLMGLRPEHTPEDKELRDVKVVAAYTPTDAVSQAEHFQRIQAMKAMPEMKLLRLEESDNESASTWAETYESTLVSFDEL